MACTPSHSPALEEIYAAIESSPEDALDRASSISPDSLSPHDRRFLQLIKIKAADKIDIYQPNDTLITKLIAYYSDHEADRFYPEALYYGGRVYAELGDYPMALRHFQDALDLLPQNTDRLHLRGCTLSQIAYILNNLRLNEEAVEILNEIIEYDIQLNDSINLIYDLKNLATAYYHLKKHNESINILRKSYELSKRVLPEYESITGAYLASMLSITGKQDSALNIIKSLPEYSLDIDSNNVFGIKATIYLRNHIYDSAYVYADKLVRSHSLNNKINGFNIILNKELQKFYPKDSIAGYANQLSLITESFQYENATKAAIIQNSYYNYAQHDRKRKKAEQSRNRYAFIALSLGACVAVLTALILWFMYRSKSQRLKYLEALDSIRMLSETIEKSHRYTEPKAASEIDNNIQFLDDKNAPDSGLNALLAGTAYKNLCAMMEAQKAIAENSVLWDNLQSEFDAALPEFRHRLNQLAHSRISADDYKLIMLVKYGFNSAQISGIINKSKSTVSYRYSEIAKRIFNESFKFDKLRSLIKSI